MVLEEIAMYEDEPQDRVHDFLAEAVYGDHPLGRRVLGEAAVIAGVPRDEIAAYHSGHYVAENANTWAAKTPAMIGAIRRSAQPIAWAAGDPGLANGPRKLNTVATASSRRATPA